MQFSLIYEFHIELKQTENVVYYICKPIAFFLVHKGSRKAIPQKIKSIPQKLEIDQPSQ